MMLLIDTGLSPTSAGETLFDLSGCHLHPQGEKQTSRTGSESQSAGFSLSASAVYFLQMSSVTAKHSPGHTALVCIDQFP